MEKKRCYGCMKLKTESPICEYCGYDERTQNEPHRLPAGMVLKEQYLVGKVLGQGGFGITYLGWDLYLDIPVAIKEYYPTGVVMRDTTVTMDVVSCAGDEGARFRNNKERFLREAKMLARFSQVPEIVQVKNFFLANNTAYIVMEYVEGTTLKQYVTDHSGKLSVEQTLSILRPVIEALCKVHKAGLVHRDISPDNIMMLPGGGVKLLDFGAVRDVGDAAVDKPLTKSTEAILKQGYAPIEQYQKRGGLGPWTDVYALCATIYYCLTGEVPPDAPERLLGYEDLDLQKKIPALSEAQVKALEHGMALRSEQRTDSMDTLYQELFCQPAEEKSPVTKPQPVTKQQPPVPVRKAGKKPKKKTASLSKKQGALIAGIVVVLILICLVPLLSGRGSDLPGPAPGEETVPSVETTASRVVSGECGSNVTWELNLDTGEMVFAGSGEMDDYWSDDWDESYPHAPWHDYREKITSVTIGNGIRNVGECAFFGYGTVKTVQFSDTVTDIDPHAFWGCGLEELELPTNLKTIGEGAFSGNPLKNVVFPDSVEYIGPGSFDGCVLLESVTIGPNTRLNYDIWYSTPIFGYRNQNITIRSYRNTMAEDYAQIMGYPFEATGENAWDAEGQCGDNLNYYLDRDTGFLKIQGTGDMWDFNGTWMQGDEHEWVKNRELPPWTAYREDIRVVSLGDGVTSIGENAFESCNNLVDVNFGNTVERIGFQSFLSTAVDEIILPESVTKIDSCAFNWCEKLWKMQLPEGLEVLENEAIADCMNLRELYIGRNTVIRETEKLPFTNHQNTYPDLTICGLRNSDAERFAAEYGIPFVIGAWGRKAEAQGQCGDNVWWFKSGDTLVLYGTGDTWFYRVNDQDRQDWGWEFPESWLHYGNPEFYTYRNEIRRIIILPGIEHVGSCLFCDMRQLEEVDLGTAVRIETNFSNCNALTELVLPESVTSIGGWALSDCRNLRRVTIENGSSGLTDGLFAGCTSLEEVWFSGKESIDNMDLFSPLGEDYSDHVTFYVKDGSDALRYAKENGIPYVIVDTTPSMETEQDMDFLEMLSDDSVKEIVLNEEFTKLRAQGVVEITKPVIVPEGCCLDAGFTSFLIQAGGSLEIRGQLDDYSSLVVREGGSLRVEDGGSCNVRHLWLEREEDLILEPGASTSLFGTDIEFQEYRNSNDFTILNENIFADAVTVTTARELLDAGEKGGPIVIAGNIILTEPVFLSRPVRIESGARVLGTLFLGEGGYLANYGTLSGELYLGYGCVNYGQLQGDVSLGSGALLNCGTMETEALDNMGGHLINYGTLNHIGSSDDKYLELRSLLINAGELTLGGNSPYLNLRGNTPMVNTGSVRVMDGARAYFDGHLINVGSLTVERGGELSGDGFIDITDPAGEGGLNMEPDSVLHFNGVIAYAGGEAVRNRMEPAVTGAVDGSTLRWLSFCWDECDCWVDTSRMLKSWMDCESLPDGSTFTIALSGNIKMNQAFTVNKGLAVPSGATLTVNGDLILEGEDAFLYIDGTVDLTGHNLILRDGAMVVNNWYLRNVGSVIVSGVSQSNSAVYSLLMNDGWEDCDYGNIILEQGGRFISLTSLNLEADAQVRDGTLMALGGLRQGSARVEIEEQGYVQIELLLEMDAGAILDNRGTLYVEGWEPDPVVLGGTVNNYGTLVQNHDDREESPMLQGVLNNYGVIESHRDTWVTGVLNNRGSIYLYEGFQLIATGGGRITGSTPQVKEA